MIGAAAGYGSKEGGRAGVEAVQRQQQQQIENQRNEKKDTRDETLFNAQMTRFNIENIVDLQRLEGTTQKEHQDFIASRAPVVEAHRLAGHKPVRENVSEEQHIADLKDPSQADKLNLEWEPVDIAPHVAKVDGKDVITHQTVWNAYDKTSEIPLLPKTLDRWEDSGAITHAERGILDKSLKIDPVTQQPMMPYSAFISKDTNSRTLEARNREKKNLDDAETVRNDEHLLRGAQTREALLKGNEAAGAISDAAHDRRMRGFSESADRKLLNNGGDWTLSKDPKDKTHLTADEFMAKQWGPNGVQAKINNLQTTLNNIDNRLRYATDGTAEYNELWKERISTNTELETEKSHSAPAGLLKTQPPPPDTSTAAGLKSTVMGYAPDNLKKATDIYLSGGTFPNGSKVGKPESYDDFVSNLVSSQSEMAPELKLDRNEYQKMLNLGKSYFDNLTKVQKRTEGEETAKKLATVRTRNPGKTITEADLDYYDDQGHLAPQEYRVLD
jgi:hypothetical protein